MKEPKHLTVRNFIPNYTQEEAICRKNKKEKKRKKKNTTSLATCLTWTLGHHLSNTAIQKDSMFF